MVVLPRSVRILSCLALSIIPAVSWGDDAAARARDIYERSFQDAVNRSPEWQTSLGIKTDQDKWSDHSDARAIEDLSRGLGFLAELKASVRLDALDPAEQLSYRLFEYRMTRRVADFPFRFHAYEIDQTGGPLAHVPNLLITQHQIDDLVDARAYVARLRGIAGRMAQVKEALEAQAARGVVPPRWVFPQAAAIGRNIITGRPFDESGADSPLWADITRKLQVRDEFDEATRRDLLEDARRALLEVVGPAYEDVLARWAGLEAIATDDDGVWKLPGGAAYYAHQLAYWTTTSLTADEIHETGVRDVARIHDEMRAIMREVGFAGDLQAFFGVLRDDPRFFLPDTAEGRRDYLDRATAVVEEMKARLDQLFLRKPRADLIVKATEEYREKSAAKAFYQSPAPTGTRPGMYYVTLYNMREMPLHQLEAIAYHEGVPGHHMQIAIAQELRGLPRFRRFGGYGAYVEGWGLYSELLPREIGLYADPYSNFGRLSTELWRAARLVVDTGIHARRWTRREAIDYFVANTALSEDEAVREIERYIMWPGQATSYKIGMIRILELRDLARRELGGRFDIREFHDVILRDGALPLDLLEEQVRAWIRETRG